MFKTAFITLFILFFGKILFCQNYAVEYIDYKNGLTQSCGIAITKQNEYMWFATQDGLNRFDGTRIKVFQKKDFPGLKSNYINSLIPQGENKLWIGTSAGLSLMDTDNNEITAYKTDQISYVEKLFLDENSNLWVTAQNKGLRVQFNSQSNFTTVEEFNDEIIAGFASYKNDLIIASNTAIYKFDLDKKKVNNVEIPPYIKNKMGRISSVFLDSQGQLWIGTFINGLFKFKLENDKLIYIEFYNQSNSGLKSNEISCISEDKESTIWVGTGSASAYYFSGNNLNSINIGHKNKRSIEGYTYSFYHDGQGITWVGTDGDGIAKCDKFKAKFNNILEFDKKVFPHNKGELVFDVSGIGSNIYIGVKDRSLIEYNEKTKQFSERINLNPQFNRHNPRQIIAEQDSIWLGYEMGIKIFSNTKKKYLSPSVINEANFVYTIAITKNNEVWMGGNEGLKIFRKGDLSSIPIYYNNPLFKITNDFIRVLHRDRFDNIWVGTTGNGLFHYNYSENKLTKIDTNQNFDCSNIRCFKEVNQNMFVGTECGIYILSKDFKVLKKITTKDGLPNDVIYSIEKSLIAGYWIGSNAGLTFLSEDFKKIKNYTVDDGLPSNEFNGNSSFVSDSGLFYFGTMKGLVVFDEKDISQNNYQPLIKISDIYIDNVLISGNKWQKDKILNVEHDQKYVKIVLAISNYSDSKNNYCEYKIKGFNEWTRIPESNELLFTGLSSGKYQLSIKGFNNDDVPSLNTINLIIDIETPFWKQWWLYLLLVICIILFSYYLFKRELKNKELELKYKAEIEEIRNVALRSQMNPHFIFNCLSAIEYLMISDNSDKAQLYLNKFSRLVRNTLDFTNNELVTLKDEISHLNLYMDLENMRFENRINYECIINADINLEDIQFPPLVLQPLVENSIKHGLIETIVNPKVIIKISRTEKELHILITDNGIGISNRKSNSLNEDKKSYGLEVTRQRLQMYSRKINKHSDFKIYDLSEVRSQGTEIKIEIEL